MRRLLCCLSLLAAGWAAATDEPPADKEKAKKDDGPPLQVGKDLPGPFQAYNVTGPHRGRFHCPVSDHGFDPAVLLFHKNLEVGEALTSLLKKLDTAIEKNPDARLAAAVVFLPDELPDVSGSTDKDPDINSRNETNSKNDDARLEMVKKIEQAATDMKLRHVVLCLASKADVDKYGLSETRLVTVVLYNKLKVESLFLLGKNDFDETAVGKIMADVTQKLGAKRK